jgi:hypothetical protein
MSTFTYSGLLKVSGTIQAETQAEAWEALTAISQANLWGQDGKLIGAPAATFHDGQPLTLDLAAPDA